MINSVDVAISGSEKASNCYQGNITFFGTEHYIFSLILNASTSPL